MAKWLDKYEDGGEYLGTTNKGFNYNGAWGGPSMQMGGELEIPQAQQGKKKKFQPSISAEPTVFLQRPSEELSLLAVPGVNIDASPTERLALSARLSSPFFFSERGISGLENFDYNVGARYRLNDNNEVGVNYGNQGIGANLTHTLFNKKKGKKKTMEMGGSVPGSVGFTYARTQGIPSEGPYGKKTVPSAQKGKKIDIRRVPKRTDSDAENLFEILDPTGLSSWDDIIRSYKDPNAAWWETGLEVLGAIPFLGNIAKVTKPGIHLAKYSNVDKALFNTLPKNKSLSRTVSGASKVGRGTDAYQAYDEYQNGGEMQFYQNGLDWTPRNISEYGSEIPMAQPGITQPLRGDIQTRGNQNLLTEIATQRTKQKKAQAARERTTIGPDTRTEKEKQKAREFTEQVNKRRKDLGFMEGSGHSQEYIDKKRAEADKILKAIEVGTLLEAPVSAGIKGVAKAAPRVGEYLTQGPLRNAYKLNPSVLKENPNVILHRVQKPGQTEQLVMEQFSQPSPTAPLASNQPGWGRAFSSDPSDMYYYSSPSITKTRGYTESPEILKLTMPKAKLDEFSAETYNAARSAEGLPLYGSNRPTSEFILPIEDVIQSEKFGAENLDQLLQQATEFNTPHWWEGFGKKEVPKKEGGGVVKDNMGYWNPDNWGRIVEIDSPNITMKGVNQDLIGVSDEGDVQYMEREKPGRPGKDYKFKGKKVKEYPVGKYGVNQQDEKTVQHLDQLLNFTNKPKAKNGWLDKYN